MQMRTPRGTRLAALGAAVLMLAGCAAGDALPPTPPDHPANARARAAAIPYVPSPFDADAPAEDPAAPSMDPSAMPGMNHGGSMNDMNNDTGSMHHDRPSEEAHHADH